MDEISLLAMLNRLQQIAHEEYGGDQLRAWEAINGPFGRDISQPIPERDSFGMYTPIDNGWAVATNTYVPVGVTPVVEQPAPPSFMDWMGAVFGW